MKTVRILIAHDWSLMCQGVRAVLCCEDDCEVIGEAHVVADALRLCAQLQPDIMIVDINLPDDNLFETLAAVKTTSPLTTFIALTMEGDLRRIRQAAEFGVRGFVARDATPEQLGEAVRTVYAGQFYIGSSVARDIFHMIESIPDNFFYTTDAPFNTLTEREREIFGLMVRGNSNKEIAFTLGISPKTVETHSKHIKDKLGVHDPVSLVRYAIRIGIIES